MRNKKCRYCEGTLSGRPDKKFCDRYCRSSYHNDEIRKNLKHVRFINTLLKHNRNILQSFYKAGKRSVRKESLKEEGFSFDYFTHVKRADEHRQKYFCYELSYVEEDTGTYRIMRSRLKSQ